ncbi:MAG: PLD nuclease N-terminal domain-containing protein [Planctomycetota bacterium]
MLWQVLNIVYLIVWSVLLVNCLLRRQFYPILGRGWGTKVLWLLTFVFFNPLLTLLYLAFGFLLRPAKGQEQGPSISFASVVAIGCIAVVLVLFELPAGGYDAGPVVLLSESCPKEPNEPSGSFHGLEAHAGIIRAKNNVQTLSSTAAGGGGRVSVCNIMLICQNSHRLLDRATREFQKSLVKLPYVDKVTYYPVGTKPEPGGLLPDVFVTIDMPKFSERILLRSRHVRATIKWQASTSILGGPSHSVGADTPPVVQFNIESQLDHESRMVGVESRRARYKLEANNIAGEMAKSISKQLENLLDKHGRLPATPETFNGTYHEPPELPFLKAGSVEQIISGSGLLANNHTVWRLVEGREADEALRAYRDELKTLGWTEEGLDKDSLRMRKENEHIYVYHPRSRDPQTTAMVWSKSDTPVSGTPMVVHYESYLSGEQMRKAMGDLLDSEVQFETLLVFEKYLRAPEQRERLKSIIERSPVCTLSGYLVLANFWADGGEMEKGRDALLHARAMERAEKSQNARTQEIRNLAKKLGNEGLIEVPLAEEILLEVGFTNAEKIAEPLEIERGLNEPVLFYRRIDSGELQTLALRVINSREQSSSAPYQLLTVQKRRGSSSVNETDGNLRPDGVWVSESSLQDFSGDNKSAHCKIECLGNERFAFTIAP